jgi:hypothetical protein
LSLEAFFVRLHVTVEMVLEQLIQSSIFGMSWPVLGRRIPHQKAWLRREEVIVICSKLLR